VRFKDQTNEIEKRLGLTEEEQVKVRAATLNRIQLEGLEVVVTEQIADSRRDQLALETALNTILGTRIQKLAQEAALSSLNATREAEGERTLLAAQLLADAALNNAQKRLLLAKAEFDVLDAQITVAQGIRDKGLEQQIKNIKKLGDELNSIADQLEQDDLGDDEKNRLLEARIELQKGLDESLLLQNQLRQENLVIGELELLQLQQAQELLDQLQAQKDTPFLQGLLEGLDAFVTEAQDTFTTFRDIVKNSFDALGDLLAGTIVNALTGQEQDFKQALGKLLASVAQQIIAMFIKLAIAKAILGLGFLGGQGGSAVPGIGGLGFAKGGQAQAPQTIVVDSPFRKAKGLATGGFGQIPASTPGGPSVRRLVASLQPKNVDPRDTVPIWTQPGEWVVQKRAVDKYGSDVMSRINDMLVDPASLRAISGVNARGGSNSRVAGAAQQGGAITETSGAPTTEVTTGESSGPAVALVAGTDENMQQMLAGGGNALLDFLRENRDEFLGQERAPV
jgi:lambda family phage tail tape measure protein